MAVKWSTIREHPTYRKASPETRGLVRQKYFDEVIKKDSRYKPEWEEQVKRSER